MISDELLSRDSLEHDEWTITPKPEHLVPDSIAPAYYRDLAIVYRKDDRHQDEVEVLERYVDACRELGN